MNDYSKYPVDPDDILVCPFCKQLEVEQPVNHAMTCAGLVVLCRRRPYTASEIRAALTVAKLTPTPEPLLKAMESDEFCVYGSREQNPATSTPLLFIAARRVTH